MSIPAAERAAGGPKGPANDNKAYPAGSVAAWERRSVGALRTLYALTVRRSHAELRLDARSAQPLTQAFELLLESIGQAAVEFPAVGRDIAGFSLPPSRVHRRERLQILCGQDQGCGSRSIRPLWLVPWKKPAAPLVPCNSMA